MGKTGKHLYPNTLNLFGYIQEYLKSQLKLSQIVPPFADFSGTGGGGRRQLLQANGIAPYGEMYSLSNHSNSLRGYFCFRCGVQKTLPAI